MRNYAETVRHAYYIMDIFETKFRCTIRGRLMLAQGPHLPRPCLVGQFSEALSVFHGSLPTFSEMHAVTYPAGMHARAYAFKIKHASWMPEGVKLQFARITRSVRLFLNLHPGTRRKPVVFFFCQLICFVERLLAVKKKKYSPL